MGNIVVQNLSVAYENKLAVRNCSFELRLGESVVILGASGDGKTTLLKSIAGLLPRKEGTVMIGDDPVLASDEQLVPGHDLIKLVNQDFDLNTYHTVRENIALRLLQYDEDYKEERIAKLLRLTKLTTYADHKSTELSGGQQQRLAIARALADEPDWIFLDEPFNQLDFTTKNTITTHLKRYLNEENVGIVMVTHNGAEALEWADRILLMEEGKVIRDASPEAIYNAPKSLKEARFFGWVNQLNMADELITFRPNDFSLEKTEAYAIPISLRFQDKRFLGDFSRYFFLHNRYRVYLNSVEDLSNIDQIFVKKLVKTD